MPDVRDDLRNELAERARSARLSEEFSDRVQGAATRRHRNRRLGAMTLAASVLVIALGGATLALLARGDEAPTQLVAGPSENVATDTWVPMPNGPLSPRDRALAFTVGNEVLIFSGSDRPGCYDAGCPPRRVPTLVDGAAYDPATQTWRSIADAPTPMYSASGAVIGDRLYLWADAPCPPNAYCVPIRPDFLIYDVSEDAWRRGDMPRPSPLDDLQLAADGDRIIGFRAEVEPGDIDTDLVYDPATDTWTPLTADPLQPGYNRAIVPHDGDLFLFSVPTDADPDREEVYEAAVLEGGSTAWRELPESPVFGSQRPVPTWAPYGELIVNPIPNDEFDPEDTIDRGGVFDTSSETWQPLPQPPSSLGPFVFEVVVGPGYLTSSGFVYSPYDGRWIDPPPADGLDLFGAARAWVGDTMVIWGGTDDDRTSDTGATWTVTDASPDATDHVAGDPLPAGLPTPAMQATLDAGTPVVLNDAGDAFCVQFPGGSTCDSLSSADAMVAVGWDPKESRASIIVVDGERRLDHIEVVDAGGAVVRTADAEAEGLYVLTSVTQVPDTIRIVGDDGAVLRTVHPAATAPDDASAPSGWTSWTG